ncbi:sulfatase [Haloferula sp.]|uniref:sulfatase n=1 Tax=Haloferula sp. TaxID=2497595 RepID=UPI0032A12CA8
MGPLLLGASPNVLFISVDDWNDWVGAYGDEQAKTPNLDRLAAAGTAFTNAHTNAVYCAPSRTSLMTGKQPFSTGCYTDEPHFAATNRPGIKDLPLWFRENGYQVRGGGKLYHHMPGFIDWRGWDEYFIWNDDLKTSGWGLKSWGGGAPLPDELPASPIARYLSDLEKKRNPDRPANKVNSHMEWGVLPDHLEEKMADTICANWAADFLRSGKAEEGKPFFLGFGLYAPHKPNFVPQKYFKMYPLKEVSQPGMRQGDLEDLPPLLRKKTLARKSRIDGPVRELKAGKKAVRGYLAALSYADAMVGRVLTALAEGPYAENTIVVLWSDNGYHLGEKGCWAKHTLWERTSNVPFIWAGPSIDKGAVVETTVSLLDTYPTLVDLCGLPKNPENEGVSLASILAEPDTAKDRSVLQSDRGSVAVINQEWRFTRYDNGEEELYHISEDPGEHHNLAAQSEFAGVIEKMAKDLPKQMASPGRGPGGRGLRLKVEGENCEWVSVPLKKK